MLYKIECDELREGPIIFHEGLNIVLGDKEASNSIGKTTALKLVNLSFGSNEKKEFEDLIHQYGKELRIIFTHIIDGKEMIFSRNFADWDNISCLSESSDI